MSNPKYQLIIDHIKEQIATGQLKTSQKLPSIRQLSQTYACNKDTVQKALSELRYQKLIYPIAKSGYYVLENPDQQAALPLPPSDIANLAYEDFHLCLNETLVGRESYLFNYYHKQEGLEDLLQAVQTLLVEHYVYSKIDQLVITTGTQQALYILSQMTLPHSPGKILLEEPSYPRMLDLVKSLKIPYQTIKRDWQGLDLKELERIFQTGEIKYFYTISRLHNPLGSSYSQAQKEAIISLAHRYQVYIIEDDYLADFDSKHQAPLHYFDTNHRVIYIKSFSAPIFPALRLATVVLPPSLLKPFLSYKQMIDYDTNLILQKALALYISNGMYAKNVAALKRQFISHQENNKALIHRFKIPLEYSLLNQQIIFSLDKIPKATGLISKLKTFDSLSNHYITPPQKPDYIRLSGQDQIESFLELIKENFK